MAQRTNCPFPMGGTHTPPTLQSRRKQEASVSHETGRKHAFMFLEISEAPARAAFSDFHGCREIAIAPPAQDTCSRDAIAFGYLFDIEVEGIDRQVCGHVGLQIGNRGGVAGVQYAGSL